MWRTILLGLSLLLSAEGLSRWWLKPRSDGFVRAWTIHNTIDTGRKPSLLPLAGLANRPTYLCREADGDITYTADAHGFHNPEWVTEPDVALIGDSFIQGHCVPEEKQLASLLRSDGRKVLNLGLRGSGPLSQLGVLQEYALPVKPKRIIWFLLANDFLFDIERELGEPALLRYLDGKTQGLLTRGPEIEATLKALEADQPPPSPAELYFPTLLTTTLFRLTQPQPTRAFEDAKSFNPKLLSAYAAILGQAKKMAGVPIDFVFVPDSWLFTKADGPALRALVAELKVNLKKEGIELHDPMPLYEKDGFANFAALDGYYGHYSAKGFRLLSDFTGRVTAASLARSAPNPQSAAP